MRVADKPTKEISRRSSRAWNRPVSVLSRARTQGSQLGVESRPGIALSRTSRSTRHRVARAAYSFIKTGPVVSIHVTTRHGRRKPRQLFTIPYRSLLAMTLLVVVCGGLWVSVRRTHADVVFYTPAACLGGWANPTHAQGEMEKGEQLESGNSALYAGGTESLYCGNFIGSKIEGADIQSVTLRLVWGQVEPPAAVLPGEYIDAPVLQHTKDAPPEQTVTGEVTSSVLPTEATESQSQEAKPTEPEAVDAPLPVTRSDLPANESIPQPMAPEVKGEHTGAEPSQKIEAPVEQSPMLPEPQSYMPSVIRIAHAQEVLEPATTTTESVVQPIGDAAEESGTEAQSGNPDAFSLRYSLDGATWTEFGRVSMDKFGTEFTLPLHSIEDVGALQVGIVPIGSMHLERPILLNGMVLELRYIAHDKPVAPDPITQSLVSVESIGSVSLVKTQDKESKQAQLWVYDREGSPQWSIIAAGNEVDVASLTLLVPGYAFWVSSDSRSLSAYNIRTKTYFSHSFSGWSTEPGEQDVLVFEEAKTARLEAGQLVVRDAEGVAEAISHNPELNAEIEQLFNPTTPPIVTEEEAPTNEEMHVEQNPAHVPESVEPVANDGAVIPTPVEQSNPPVAE